MTIAISIKVNDGVVLASDSATTFIGRDSSGRAGVVNIYDNANKIFNLVKGLPIGAITWGVGSIGHASISTLAKDFRELITQSNTDYKIKKNEYTMEEIATKFKKFIFDKKYKKEFADWGEKDKPAMGFMVVGYSAQADLVEEWKTDIRAGKCKAPYLVRKQHEVGITWAGEPEAVHRLSLGFSGLLPTVLKEAKLPQAKIKAVIKLCRERLTVPLVIPPMPIQDAIDLGIFLVNTTIGFSKFSPGAPTVGGPIEVAAITKYEGFKWVERKHYFDRKLNPTEEDEQ